MSVLVGKQAPDFQAVAVKNGAFDETFRLSDLKGKHIVLFFYPLDFTFVCPTELHAFSDRLPEFAERNVEVVAVSVDSHFSHLAWLNTPRKEGGIEGIGYPIVSDIHKSICKDYDVLAEEQGIALRGLFLIDREFTVRHQVVNDLPLGRNVEEAIRMVDALQFYEKHGEVCPANWSLGAKGMDPTGEGLKAYLR